MHSFCMHNQVIWCASLAAIGNKRQRWKDGLVTRLKTEVVVVVVVPQADGGGGGGGGCERPPGQDARQGETPGGDDKVSGS
jgi:hypothetical protein